MLVLSFRTAIAAPRSTSQSLTLLLTQYRRLATAPRPNTQVSHPNFEVSPKQENIVADGSTTFQSLKDAISAPTLKAITVHPYKFSRMTDVQEAVLGMLPDLALPYTDSPNRRDLMVRARTGTGKTLAYLVPAIEARLKKLQAAGEQALKEIGLVNNPTAVERGERLFAREQVGTLILSPTRELAAQIAQEASNLTRHHPDFNVHVWIGAMSKRTQMRDFMKKGRDIVVATPGRLRDLLESEPDVRQGLSYTQQVILDEADTMLEFGFREDIEAIMKCLPPIPQRQTFLFSATIPPNVRQVAQKHLAPDHTFVDCIKDQDSPVHVDIPQYHTVVPSASQQIPHILRLIAHDQFVNAGASKVMVFFPTTKMTQLFSTILTHYGKTVLPAGRKTEVLELHSKRPQYSRDSTAKAFRNANSGATVLVTSDVSARGVDYPGVTRVIQVGIPPSREQYVHRVGRTGRGLKSIQGRGDLVLLPWEVGFISWQLTDLPIKPLTAAELKTQLASEAQKHDEAPEKTFPARNPKNSPRAVDRFQTPYIPLLEEFDHLGSQIGPRLDPDAIRETFLSLLGYYFAKSAELRVSTSVILEGCKQWSTDALAQDTPPYVSEMFLKKIGYNDHRTKWYGSEPRTPYSAQARKDPHWMGRGSMKHKSRPWAVKRHETSNPDPEAEQYRTTRYSMTQRSKPPRRY